MELKLGVSAKQTQNLAITPQMQQALKLLQLSNVELNEHLTEEIEKNPFLELNEKQNKNESDHKDKPKDDGLADANNSSSPSPSPSPATTTSSSNNNIDQINNDGRQKEIEDYDSRDYSGSEEINHTQTITERTLHEKESLSVFLEKQIRLENIDDEIKNIAIGLLGWIDDNGYLIESDEELSNALGIKIKPLIEARNLIKTLEPLGVGGKNFIECIRIQLLAANKLTDKLSKLLDNLHMIEKNQISQLMRLCNIEKSEFLEMMDQIKSLDPRPGLKFTSVSEIAKLPDLIVKKDKNEKKNNGWVVEVNDDTLPKVLFLDRLWEELARQPMKKEDKNYLKGCNKSGKWIQQALAYRKSTMLRVGSAILKKQLSFFEEGINSLVPMTMKEIAIEIDVHESTVSRGITNKLLECPRGIYELKYFFTQGLKSSSGDGNLSSATVKDKIRKIINEEVPGKPISDTKITSILCENGITIARRTVAKYRENLGIPPASARRVKQQLGYN